MGYAKPPKEHQFSSENQPEKRGRPKKIPAIDELLADVLGEEKEGKTAAQAILMALRAKATKGDVRAAEVLLDRAYGKAKQFIETNITAMPKPEAQSPDRDELLKEVQSKLDEIDRQGENQK